eukprot:CAMPEP_0168387064 /NCGR_PEP_ID=MMETSP0228-20121227/15751_1 /TAXON_ID=133427 /ORGANISM="Protoceratium reticulatum, Strain CCCM 535 (=CCMP 1889)" /LENGTH=347 /DNA_ID=CAMNT_0008400285 /DNA_START=110 /DNA_END=1154 /DNA_ORIENTATION=-
MVQVMDQSPWQTAQVWLVPGLVAAPLHADGSQHCFFGQAQSASLESSKQHPGEGEMDGLRNSMPPRPFYDEFEPVQVLKYEGHWYSVDNRRLKVFKIAFGLESPYWDERQWDRHLAFQDEFHRREQGYGYSGCKGLELVQLLNQVHASGEAPRGYLVEIVDNGHNLQRYEEGLRRLASQASYGSLEKLAQLPREINGAIVIDEGNLLKRWAFFRDEARAFDDLRTWEEFRAMANCRRCPIASDIQEVKTRAALFLQQVNHCMEQNPPSNEQLAQIEFHKKRLVEAKCRTKKTLRFLQEQIKAVSVAPELVMLPALQDFIRLARDVDPAGAHADFQMVCNKMLGRVDA